MNVLCWMFWLSKNSYDFIKLRLHLLYSKYVLTCVCGILLVIFVCTKFDVYELLLTNFLPRWYEAKIMQYAKKARECEVLIVWNKPPWNSFSIQWVFSFFPFSFIYIGYAFFDNTFSPYGPLSNISLTSAIKPNVDATNAGAPTVHAITINVKPVSKFYFYFY